MSRKRPQSATKPAETGKGTQAKTRGTGFVRVSRIRGRVEKLERGALVGWLLDTSEPIEPVTFDLFANGEFLGRHVANVSREVLRKKGMGTGEHGFRVSLRSTKLALGDIIFRAVDARTKEAVEGTIRVEQGWRDKVFLIFGTARGKSSSMNRRMLVSASTSGPITATNRPSNPAAPPKSASEPAPRTAATKAHQPGRGGSGQPSLSGSLERSQKDFISILETDFKAEKWPKVIADARAWLDHHQERPDYRIISWLGRAQIYVGLFNDAVTTLRWFEAHDQSRHSSLFYFGVALDKSQQVAEARNVFLKCMKASPSTARYVYEAAKCSMKLLNGGYGMLQPEPALLNETLDLFSKAAASSPTDFKPCREMSHILVQVERFEEALMAMTESLRRAPTNATLHMEHSRLLTRMDRLGEALAAARQSLHLDSQSDGAAFAVRILERWLDARRNGAIGVDLISASTLQQAA